MAALAPLTSLPDGSDFTLLSTHQSATPASFNSSKPILHLRATSVSVAGEAQDWNASPLLAALRNASVGTSDPDAESETLVADATVLVTSANLLIFFPALTQGLSVPYPLITFHALSGTDLVLGLSLPLDDEEIEAGVEEEGNFAQLRVRVSTNSRVEDFSANSSTSEENGDGEIVNNTVEEKADALFKAVAACQELNPDATAQEDGEGSDDAILDGANGTTGMGSGWVTSEDFADLVDANGELDFAALQRRGFGGFVGGEEDNAGLGDGAGARRTADEAGLADGEDVGGNGDLVEGEEETKWRRTG